MQYKGMLLSSENGNSRWNKSSIIATPPGGGLQPFFTELKNYFWRSFQKYNEAFRVSLESNVDSGGVNEFAWTEWSEILKFFD